MLLNHCPNCGTLMGKTSINELSGTGSLLSLRINCPKGCSVNWKSQTGSKYGKSQGRRRLKIYDLCRCIEFKFFFSKCLFNFTGNVDVVAALTFAGIPLAKFEQFAWIINLKFFHSSTFYRIRKNYIAPVIRCSWEEEYIKVIFLFYIRKCEIIP